MLCPGIEGEGQGRRTQKQGSALHPPTLQPPTKGCVFAKSCTLPNGVIEHKNPNGFVPLESLTEYGAYAVLGTVGEITSAGTPLGWVGGSGSAASVVTRLGGSLALAATSTGSAVAAPFLVGSAALLMPNTTSSDSAFYKSEQYAQLSQGNTQVRMNLKYLDDDAVSVYGFYTGNQPDWRQVPVIAAVPRGEQLVADVGNGLEVIWTPAVDTGAVLGIPALEGMTLKLGPGYSRRPSKPTGFWKTRNIHRSTRISSSGFPPSRRLRRSICRLVCAMCREWCQEQGRICRGYGLIMPAAAWGRPFRRQWSMYFGGGRTAALIRSGVRFGEKSPESRILRISLKKKIC